MRNAWLFLSGKMLVYKIIKRELYLFIDVIG